MRDILEELNMSVGGVIGSFVIGVDGGVEAQDVPELILGPLDRVSKVLFNFSRSTSTTKRMNRLTVNSENATVICVPVDKRILVAIVDKEINMPLFKLMSNMAVTRIKDAPTAERVKTVSTFPATRNTNKPDVVLRFLDRGVLQGAHARFSLIDRFGRVIDSNRSSSFNSVSPGDSVEFIVAGRAIDGSRARLARYEVKNAPLFDYTEACDLYEKLFGVAAKRVANLIGPRSGHRFNLESVVVKASYPEVFAGVGFGRDGKPDAERIKLNASNMPDKALLLEALDELLLSMFNTVKKIAGPKQEQKAREELDVLLDSVNKRVGGSEEMRAIDSIQRLKIQRSGIL